MDLVCVLVFSITKCHVKAVEANGDEFIHDSLVNEDQTYLCGLEDKNVVAVASSVFTKFGTDKSLFGGSLIKFRGKSTYKQVSITPYNNSGPQLCRSSNPYKCVFHPKRFQSHPTFSAKRLTQP